MILPLHIVIAMLSVLFTTYLYLRPTRLKLRVSYGLVSATLVSGTYLVLSMQAHMLQACITGLLYVSGTCIGIALARGKLAAEHISID